MMVPLRLRQKHMKKDIDNFASVFRKNYGASVGFVIMYREADAEKATIVTYVDASTSFLNA